MWQTISTVSSLHILSSSWPLTNSDNRRSFIKQHSVPFVSIQRGGSPRTTTLWAGKMLNWKPKIRQWQHVFIYHAINVSVKIKFTQRSRNWGVRRISQETTMCCEQCRNKWTGEITCFLYRRGVLKRNSSITQTAYTRFLIRNSTLNILYA